MEGEPVQRVGDGLGLAVDIDDLDVGRGERARERRGPPWRLARPVEVGRAERLGCLHILVAERSLGEPLCDLLDSVVQGLLPTVSLWLMGRLPGAFTS